MKHLKLETYKNDEQIQIVSLNRPEVKNAFHPEMISEITQLFSDMKSNQKTKAIILKGEGTAFCAGADLNWMKEMVNYDFDQNVKDSEKLWDMFDAIIQCPVPIIGALHGAVYGGALGLVACCDYVIAHASTQFCFSEVKLGLAPAVISSFILRKIPDGLARPFMLSAEVFSAEIALRMGLVHQISVNFENWSDEIKKFSGNGVEGMHETKKLLNQINQGLSWAEQKRLTTQIISERRVSFEAQERLKKFIDKK